MTTPDEGAASEEFDPMKTMYPPQRKEGDAKCTTATSPVKNTTGTATERPVPFAAVSSKAAPEGPTPAGSGDVWKEAEEAAKRIVPSVNMGNGVGAVSSLVRDAIDRATAMEAAVERLSDENMELRQKLEVLPADWTKDASLETWFPMTAERIEHLERERDNLRKVLNGYKNTDEEILRLRSFWFEATDNNEFLRRDNAVLRQRIAELEADIEHRRLELEKRNDDNRRLKQRIAELEADKAIAEVTGVELDVCEDIKRRQQKGIAKYGMTVAANPLSQHEWLTHAYEEALDMAIYLRAAVRKAMEANP